MHRALRLASLLLLGAGPLCQPAMAETLQCHSVNGNVTCSGSGGTSCQTVDGRTVCVSGKGDVVQEFGNRAPDQAGQPAARRLWLERQGAAGRLQLDREAGKLRLRTERLDLDLED
ncbi:hypothetical protein [Roseicella frigidaeris]|uniref:Uncharacterized protein n=1 Tax=Roseicella frigidaeris TaxID=2230885 RepID=A0A327M7U8_9PROT|nr:hypothetical protein [Roseicella frigidaeris]RAI58809.1 hypothetical protein DOO78_12095 [Roseicella frigidaeris]